MHCEKCVNRKICSAPEKYDIAGCTAGYPEQEDLKIKENHSRIEYGAYFREKETRKYDLFGIGKSPEAAKKTGIKKVHMARPNKYDVKDYIILRRTVVEIFGDWELEESDNDNKNKPEENSLVYFLKERDKSGKKIYVPGKVCRYVLRGNEEFFVVKECGTEKCNNGFLRNSASCMDSRREPIENIYCFPTSEIGKTIFSDAELNKIVDAMFAEDETGCKNVAAAGTECAAKVQNRLAGTDSTELGEKSAETDNVCTDAKRMGTNNFAGADNPAVISYPEGVDSDIPSEPSEVEEVKRVLEAKARIAKYMKEHGYKCSLGDLLSAYEKCKHGDYVSFSISPCMLACKDQLEILRSVTASTLSEESKNHHDKL